MNDCLRIWREQFAQIGSRRMFRGGGFSRVREQVREHLAELGGEAVDDQPLRQVGLDRNAQDGEPPFHQQQNRAKHLPKVDFDRCLGLAIER